MTTEQLFSPSAPPAVETLPRPGGGFIAYRRLKASDPAKPTTVVFIHGLKSGMDGAKALSVEDYCRAEGRGMLRFDCSGHGGSSGAFVDGTISQWTRDALAAIDALSDGPLAVVGSSMGGWLMVLCALSRPQRVKGLLGVAPAPDFTEDLVYARLTGAQKQALERDGRLEVPNPYSETPYVYTKALIEDGRRNLVLRGAIAFDGPARILHGQRDDSAPWERSLVLMDKLTSQDVEAQFIKRGDHRLSTPQDLARLTRTLHELLQRVEERRRR